MTIQRPIGLFKGDFFFGPEMPVYVNRAIETFDMMEHRHDFVEISYVGEGSGTHHIGDRTVQVHRGDLFLIPVGISHVFRPATASPGRPLVVYNCVLSPAPIRALLREFPGGEPMASLLDEREWRRFPDPYGECRRLFLKLYDEYVTCRAGWIPSLYLTVFELLLCLLRAGDASGSRSQSTAEPGMEAVLHLLLSRYASTTVLNEAAAIAGVGQRQFYRQFKARTGMSPIDYVQTVRIDEACRLLRTTDRKVGDIASSVGYQDTAFFNGLFRKKTGLSPREYRNETERDGSAADDHR